MRDAVARTLERTAATLVVVEHRVGVWLDLATRVIILDPAGGLEPGRSGCGVGEGSGASAAGVWVPGHPPLAPTRNRAPRPIPLLTATSLDIARQRFGSAIDARAIRHRPDDFRRPGNRHHRCKRVSKSTLALTLAGTTAERARELHHQELAEGAAEQPIRWRSRELLTEWEQYSRTLNTSSSPRPWRRACGWSDRPGVETQRGRRPGGWPPGAIAPWPPGRCQPVHPLGRGEAPVVGGDGVGTRPKVLVSMNRFSVRIRGLGGNSRLCSRNCSTTAQPWWMTMMPTSSKPWRTRN